MLALLSFVLPRFGNIVFPTLTTKDNVLNASFHVFFVSNSFLFFTQIAKLVALVQNIRCYYAASSTFSIFQDHVRHCTGSTEFLSTCNDPMFSNTGSNV